MYVFLFLLIILLYSVQEPIEPFSIQIDGDLDIITPIQKTVHSVREGVHSTIVRPVYSTVMGFIPYKHHFRKLRRHLYAK
jgi:hypothetical protein